MISKELMPILGAPDAAKCSVGSSSWIPNAELCEESCYLELMFDIATPAEK